MANFKSNKKSHKDKARAPNRPLATGGRFSKGSKAFKGAKNKTGTIKSTEGKFGRDRKAFKKKASGAVNRTGNQGPDRHRETPHRRPNPRRTDTESRRKERRMHTEPKTGIRYSSVDAGS